MKIIGTNKNGYIIDVEQHEMANLIGYYSSYSDGYKNPSVGDEINISEMFKQLHTLASKKQDLSSTVKTLRNLADLLEPACPVIEKVFDTATKEETL